MSVLSARGRGSAACGRPGMCLLEVGQWVTARLGATILCRGDCLPIRLLALTARPGKPAKAVGYPGASGLKCYIAARAALKRLIRLAVVKPGAAVGTIEVPRNDAPDRGCRGSRQRRIRPVVAGDGGRGPSARAPRRPPAAVGLQRSRESCRDLAVRLPRSHRRRSSPGPSGWSEDEYSRPRGRVCGSVLDCLRTLSESCRRRGLDEVGLAVRGSSRVDDS
jgi:hypothetical protein